MSEDKSDPRTPSSAEEEGDEPHPPRIGPYRLLQKIGVGGMGEVYAADQEEPIRRRVALKLIRRGMDTDQVIARFESERQALALMDHPNIAKALDAGTTDEGRPYFVMEYVQGLPITEHCDKQRCDIPTRLDLFLKVCHGVQHAHQKAIIHRDLKPSNILVSVHEGRAVPKIIDFGVAKAMSQPLTEKTLFTAFGQLVGTPAYMSPEQAEMTVQNVDTRTDIYSLGAVLYELLAGAPPFDPKKLLREGFQALTRVLREEEPPRPSTRVSSLGEASDATARARRTERTHLTGLLRGDLDWITLKALNKEQARRYATVAEFAEDIERVFSGHPVKARPPSRAYRLRKFITRHKAGFAFGTSFALLLVVFTISLSVLYQAKSREQLKATVEARQKERIVEFLQEMVSAVDPEESEGREVTVREVLDRTAATVDEELAGQPEIQAGVQSTVGIMYRSLGSYDAAEPRLRSALDTWSQLHGEESVEAASAMNELAHLMFLKGELQEAVALFERSLEILRDQLPRDDPSLAAAVGNLGTVLSRIGRFEESEALLRESLALREETHGAQHAEVAIAQHELALLLEERGDFAEAEGLWTAALETLRSLPGAKRSTTAVVLLNFGSLCASLGRYDEAEELQREALEIRQELYGSNHPRVANALSTLGELLLTKGDFQRAEAVFRETLDLRRQFYEEDHPRIAVSLNNVAAALVRQDNYADALPLGLEALRIRKKVYGQAHPAVAQSLNGVAKTYMGLDQPEKAEPLFQEAYEILRGAFGDQHPHLAHPLLGLASAHSARGDFRGARELLEKATTLRRDALPEGHVLIVAAETELAECLIALGQFSESESLLLAIEEAAREGGEPFARSRKKSLEQLVTLYEAWGRDEKAVEYRSLLDQTAGD